MTDLAQLEAEVRQMQHDVFRGLPAWPPPPVSVEPTYHKRVCRNGHLITSKWDDDPKHGCRLCRKIHSSKASR